MNEREWVLLAKGGDQDAFCKLYGLYKDRLYRYAYYRLGNRENAEDAVADCIMAAFAQIGALKKPEAFAAWIFKILYAVCNRQIKQQIARRQHEAPESAVIPLSADIAPDAVQQTALVQALDNLKETERSIVLLSVVAGFSSKEIGKITDMTAGAVRSNLSRSLAKMRSFLE